MDLITITIAPTNILHMTAAEYADRQAEAAESANAEANALRAQLAQMTQERDSLKTSFDTLMVDHKATITENLTLRQEIEALKKPVPTPPTVPAEPAPPVDTPKRVTPVISKTELRNVAGATITTDTAPSAEKDTSTRELLKLVGGMGFNAVRFLVNHEEVKRQLKLLQMGDPNCLTIYAIAQGLTPIADTIDLMLPGHTNEQVKTYLDSLKALGFVGLFINDADRAALRDTLVDIVRQARLSSDLPLFASVTANADPSKYKALVDYVECQTFGSLPEFKRYLTMPVDLLCIDAQHDAPVSYLSEMLNLLLASKRNNLFAYTALDGQTDWRNMPATVGEYKEFLSKWNAPRQPVAPLTA